MGAYLLGIPETAIQLATTPGDVLYTCPAGVRARIDDLSFLNTTATDRTVTVHVVRSGDVIAAKNKVWDAAPVLKNTIATKGVICYEAIGKVLNPGDFLQCFASAATAITPEGSITEFS